MITADNIVDYLVTIRKVKTEVTHAIVAYIITFNGVIIGEQKPKCNSIINNNITSDIVFVRIFNINTCPIIVSDIIIDNIIIAGVNKINSIIVIVADSIVNDCIVV